MEETEAGTGAVRLYQWTASLRGWKAPALAFWSGVTAVFALPPLNLVFLAVPAFVLLLWLVVSRQRPWGAFFIGWWWGGGFFAAGLYWVSMALLVDAARFGWLIPIAIGGFALGFGLFVAIVALAVHRSNVSMAGRVLVLAGGWTLLEWVRGWLLTGFPWNPIATVWSFSDAALQPAAFIGTYGLSLLTVLAASAPAVLGNGTSRRAWAFAALVVVVPMALFATGTVRLADAQAGFVPDVRLRLVQPNITQVDKWKPGLREQHMMTQLNLSQQPPAVGERPPTHIIWGETAAPFFLADHKPWLKFIGGVTPKGGLIITGAPRRAKDASDHFQAANSMLAINDRGQVVESYDKFHLVPFGEYVPLADWLPLEKIAQGAGSFKAGPGPRTLSLKGLPPVSPLICYEVIFPGAVIATEPNVARPKWLLNLTNDAWYGRTIGPHQHFHMARLRAVEEGLPLVRVAGTGISGVVDGYGRVLASLKLGEKGVVDSGLPQALNALTLYAQTGNGLPVALAIAAMVLGLRLRAV